MLGLCHFKPLASRMCIAPNIRAFSLPVIDEHTKMFCKVIAALLAMYRFAAFDNGG